MKFLDETEADDPILSVVNLIDVFLVVIAALLTFAIIVAFFRYVSLASIVAAVFAPAYYLLVDGVAWQASGAKTLAMVAMGLLLIWRHRENIQRLLAGTESKLGARKK